MKFKKVKDVLRISWNLLFHKQDFLFLDIDHEEEPREHILKKWVSEGKADYVELYRTGNGWHVKAYFEEEVDMFYLVGKYRKFGGDVSHMWKLLNTGTQTLFKVRRGEVNTELKKVFYDA